MYAERDKMFIILGDDASDFIVVWSIRMLYIILCRKYSI